MEEIALPHDGFLAATRHDDRFRRGVTTCCDVGLGDGHCRAAGQKCVVVGRYLIIDRQRSRRRLCRA